MVKPREIYETSEPWNPYSIKFHTKKLSKFPLLTNQKSESFREKWNSTFREKKNEKKEISDVILSSLNCIIYKKNIITAVGEAREGRNS